MIEELENLLKIGIWKKDFMNNGNKENIFSISNCVNKITMLI